MRVDLNLTNAGVAKSLGAAEKALGKRLIKVSVNKALEKAARQCQAVLAARTWDAPPAKPGGTVKGAHASGALVKAWEIIPDRPSMSIAILNKKIYSPYVELGVLARERKISMDTLTVDLFEKWIKDRAIVPRRLGMSSRKFARMIIWSINKRVGVRFNPRNITKRATPRIREIFRARISEEMTRAVMQATRK